MQIELFEQILSKAPLPTLIVDQQMKMLYCNESAKKLFGEPNEQKKFDQFLAPMPLPRILFESTGAAMSVDRGADIRQLTDIHNHVFTASVFHQQLSKNKMVIYVRNISEPVDYWNKLHRQKKVEDELNRSQLLRSENFEAALKEIVTRSAETLEVERVNVWMIDAEFNSIHSIINYERLTGAFLENVTLNREDLPKYFKLLETEELIATIDSEHDQQTNELVEGYIKRFGIKSMLDIPIRIEGKMVGLICFEELDRMRVWDVSEQKFAITIAQLLAQALETSRRQEAQSEFKKALEEKQLLLREINHRVRNNFNLINDMLKFQAQKAKDDFHRQLLEDVRSRIASLTLVHRHLYQSENISKINFRDFLLDIAANMRSMAMNDRLELITLLDSCILPLNKAMISGVIINELLTKALYQTMDNQEKLLIQLQLQQRGKTVYLSVEDNMKNKGIEQNMLGLEIVQALCKQLNAELKHSSDNTTKFSITFDAE